MSQDDNPRAEQGKPLDEIRAAVLDKRVIALRPALVAALDGDLALAALYQQLVFRAGADRGPEKFEDDDGRGWWCEATRGEIADDLGISEPQARRLLEKARSLGLIETSQPFAGRHDRRLFARICRIERPESAEGSDDIGRGGRTESAPLPIEMVLEKPLEKTPARARPPFEVFWEHYPRRAGVRAGKVAAEREWKKLSAEECEGAFSGLVAYERAAKGYPQDAERYLKHRRWVGLEVETEAQQAARSIAGAESLAEFFNVKEA